MRKLSLSNWASIAEILAAVVVVLSLFYIGAELNQNTAALHDSSWQSVIDKMIDLDIAEASDPDLSRIMMTAESAPESLTREDWWRFSKIAAGRLGEIEYAFLSKRSGTLDDYRWGALEGYLAHLLCMPGYRRFWSEMGDAAYHPEFVSFVETEVVAECMSPTSAN